MKKFKLRKLLRSIVDGFNGLIGKVVGFFKRDKKVNDELAVDIDNEEFDFSDEEFDFDVEEPSFKEKAFTVLKGVVELAAIIYLWKFVAFRFIFKALVAITVFVGFASYIAGLAFMKKMFNAVEE